MKLLSKIENAFSNRQRPKCVVLPSSPSSDIYEDALFFHEKDWHELSCLELEAHSDAVFGFSPEAFCYYLPGIYSAGIRECRADLLVNSSLVSMLDRSNTPNSWDAFFLDRWATLNAKECEVTQEWLLWLAKSDAPLLFDNQLTRAYDTLSTLSNRTLATPIARGKNA